MEVAIALINFVGMYRCKVEVDLLARKFRKIELSGIMKAVLGIAEGVTILGTAVWYLAAIKIVEDGKV